MHPTAPSAVVSVTAQLPNNGHMTAATVQLTSPYGYANASPWPSNGKWSGKRP